MKKSLFMGVLCALKLLCHGQNILQEAFINGTTPADGWTFNLSGTYGTDANSGIAIPSVKLGATGNFIETPSFSHATNFSFWTKGISTDSLSKLVFFFMRNGEWTAFDSLTNIHAEKIYDYPLPDSTEKLRINFYKSAGNIAVDDLTVYKKQIDSAPPVFTDGFPCIQKTTDTRCIINISTNKKSIIYYSVGAMDSSQPKYDEIRADRTKTINLATDTILIKNLTASTDYNIYLTIEGTSPEMILDSTIYTLKFRTKNQQPDAFFSKIYKGFSYNKVLEIFNPSIDTIELKNYRIAMSTNGAGWKTTYFTFTTNAIIPPKHAYTITKTTADSTKIPFSKINLFTTSSLLSFTGNDARALQKLNDSNIWETIDLYGNELSTTDFAIAGINEAAGKYNLKRKSSYFSGNPNWTISSGTDTLSAEWELLPLTSLIDIGEHTMQLKGPEVVNVLYDSCSLELTFNRLINPKTLNNIHLFRNDSLTEPIEYEISMNANKLQLKIHSVSICNDSDYYLKIDSIQDLFGNPMKTFTLTHKSNTESEDIPKILQNKIRKEDIANFYPNPFQDYVIITNPNNIYAELIVYNEEGRMITSKKLSEQIRLNTINWEAGIYFVNLTNDFGNRSILLYKKKY